MTECVKPPEQPALATVHLDYPVNVLISYHYFQKMDIANMAAHGLRMIGDSGAFSAFAQGVTIDKEAFYAWADRYRHALAWTASLDVIGNEKATWANWVSSPKDLKLVPTIHYGSEPKAIDRYAERGCDLIGLGGMVAFKSEAPRLQRWALDVMRYARVQWPDVRFHGWGVSHPQLLMNLPWWSVDSSGFASAYRYGRLRAFDPKRGAMFSIALDGKEPAKHARLLRDVYGVSWRDCLYSTAANRPFMIRLSVRSAQLTEQFMQRRHQVTPPARFANGIGPNIHFADAGPHIMKDMYGPSWAVAVVEPGEVKAIMGPKAHYPLPCNNTFEATEPFQEEQA